MVQSQKSIKKPVYKQWWFWVIIAVVVIGIGGIATGNQDGGDNDPDVTQEDDTSQDTPDIPDTPDDQLNDLAVGTSVTIHGVTVTVNSISDGPLALMDTTPTYDVSITYKNHSGSSITISPYDWQTVLRTGSDKSHVGGDTSFHLDTLEDGEEWTGIVNLWADDDPVKVAFESTFSNLDYDAKRATWSIQK